MAKFGIFQFHFLGHLDNNLQFWLDRFDQGSQLSHNQTIPNQILPFKALFYVFLTKILTKFNFFPIFSGFATPPHYHISLRNTGTPVPSMEIFFLLGNASRPVWYWDGVAKPEKMGKKLSLVKKLVKNT